ncbi:MAG: energy transducer TonB [Rhodocyclaceae bacterium]|nr:energy transducer TonB [Rhodocyclaceae bacterium]
MSVCLSAGDWMGRLGLGDVAKDVHTQKSLGLAFAVALSAILHLGLLLAPTQRVQGEASVEGVQRYQAIIVQRTPTAAFPKEVSISAPLVESARSVRLGEARRDSRLAPAVQHPAQMRADKRFSEYIPRLQLERPPVPIEEVQLEYPPEALGQSGTVVLRLFVSEFGTVDEVEIVNAVPPGIFDSAAQRDFARVRFAPGTRFGLAVKSQLQIEVTYAPTNRGNSVEAPR